MFHHSDDCRQYLGSRIHANLCRPYTIQHGGCDALATGAAIVDMDFSKHSAFAITRAARMRMTWICADYT